MTQTPAEATPAFTALLSYGRYREISAANVVAAIALVDPIAVGGDWNGPFSGRLPETKNFQMISIDGIGMAIANMPVGLPAAVFDDGYLINVLKSKNPDRLRSNAAHLAVMPTENKVMLPQAVAQARAVSLVTLALGRLTKSDAVKWIDANNSIPVETLELFTRKVSRTDAPVAFWVRLLMTRGAGEQDAHRTTVIGTLGLWAFGLPELEYAPSDVPADDLAIHAYAACQHILSSGKTINAGDTIGVDLTSGRSIHNASAHQPLVFKVESTKRGIFQGRPVLRLSRPLAGEKTGAGTIFSRFLKSSANNASDAKSQNAPNYITPPEQHPGSFYLQQYRGVVASIAADHKARKAGNGMTFDQLAEASLTFMQKELSEGIASGKLPITADQLASWRQ